MKIEVTAKATIASDDVVLLDSVINVEGLSESDKKTPELERKIRRAVAQWLSRGEGTEFLYGER